MTKDILPPEVLAAVKAGNKIEAIKQLRRVTGLGLAQAKDWIESCERVRCGKIAGSRIRDVSPLADTNQRSESTHLARVRNPSQKLIDR